MTIIGHSLALPSRRTLLREAWYYTRVVRYVAFRVLPPFVAIALLGSNTWFWWGTAALIAVAMLRICVRALLDKGGV